MTSARIALVGDLHSAWDDKDAYYFNHSEYEAILVTGDLGSSSGQNTMNVARSLARVERDTFVMLGNNDAREYAQVVAELNYQAGRSALLDNLLETPSISQRVKTCGYSAHALSLGELELTLIAGRPFAMGGGELSFPQALTDSFGISSLEESTDRLTALVSAARTEHVIFLAHNGPYGLGALGNSPFGRDFHPDAGDWGDRDLALAIQHAEQIGRRVLAVIAGHMHWSLRFGGERQWLLERDGILYVNAARVPRHRRHPGSDSISRHHLALSLTPERAQVEEVWVTA